VGGAFRKPGNARPATVVGADEKRFAGEKKILLVLPNTL
jgi:hypothetical protein